MTTRFYPKQSHANLTAAIWDIVKWLINDGHALTGPNWEVIEAWDATRGRSIPSDSHDLDTLAASHNWRTGSLVAGDWIVLRSQTGVAGTKFELYIELQSTTVIYLGVIPFADFATGGSSVSPPTFPSTAFGGGALPAGLVSLTGFTTTADHSVVADEGMAAFLFDNSTTCYWCYAGEVVPARLTGTPADDRPYVIMDSTSLVYWYALAIWNRLSPVDDTTILQTGSHCEVYSMATSGVVNTTGYDVNLLGLWLVLPIGIYFHDTSHRHFAGYLKNMGACNGDKGAAGTIGSKTWMYRNNTGSGSRCLCFAWDGSTDYG